MCHEKHNLFLMIRRILLLFCVIGIDLVKIIRIPSFARSVPKNDNLRYDGFKDMFDSG